MLSDGTRATPSLWSTRKSLNRRTTCNRARVLLIQSFQSPALRKLSDGTSSAPLRSRVLPLQSSQSLPLWTLSDGTPRKPLRPARNPGGLPAFLTVATSNCATITERSAEHTTTPLRDPSRLYLLGSKSASKTKSRRGGTSLGSSSRRPTATTWSSWRVAGTCGGTDVSFAQSQATAQTSRLRRPWHHRGGGERRLVAGGTSTNPRGCLPTSPRARPRQAAMMPRLLRLAAALGLDPCRIDFKPDAPDVSSTRGEVS